MEWVEGEVGIGVEWRIDRGWCNDGEVPGTTRLEQVECSVVCWHPYILILHFPIVSFPSPCSSVHDTPTPPSPPLSYRAQKYAAMYFTDITRLLARLPRCVLLLLKTNDCLRSLDALLVRSSNTQLASLHKTAMQPCAQSNCSFSHIDPHTSLLDD